MPVSPPRLRPRHWLSLAAVGLGLVSCRTIKFYSQAAQGQMEIFHKACPISKVLVDPATKPELRKRLALVESIRDYARTELRLPADKQFCDYADLQRRYVVWVVFAAPEFDTEAHTWWYPLVGTLKYRGFFTEKAAKEEAEKLKAQGFDVHVGGTEAYSTLGWFADPVLNTFINRNEPELAELIFHELTHARLFLPGDTDFNEALATAVAEASVRRWLTSRGETAKLATYEHNLAKDRQIIRLLLDTQTKLKAAYATGTDLAGQKAAAFRDMEKSYAAIRQQWSGDSRYDRFFAMPMNNARLNTAATYYDLLPAFERLLKQCDGDLEKFFSILKGTKSWSKKERRARLTAGTLQ